MKKRFNIYRTTVSNKTADEITVLAAKSNCLQIPLNLTELDSLVRIEKINYPTISSNLNSTILENKLMSWGMLASNLPL